MWSCCHRAKSFFFLRRPPSSCLHCACDAIPKHEQLVSLFAKCRRPRLFDHCPTQSPCLPRQVADYEAVGGALAALGLPTVITQEGGYEMGAIAAVVESFLKPFAGP